MWKSGENQGEDVKDKAMERFKGEKVQNKSRFIPIFTQDYFGRKLREKSDKILGKSAIIYLERLGIDFGASWLVEWHGRADLALIHWLELCGATRKFLGN